MEYKMEITLTAEQLTIAYNEGEKRYNRALEWKLKQKYGTPHIDRKKLDQEAAAAEMAFALAMGFEWTSQKDKVPNGPIDVTDLSTGEKYGVSHTTLPHGRLFIHEDRDENLKYVLVTGKAPTFNIAGWITGKEAKTMKQYYGSLDGKHKPCFAIPQGELHQWE